MRPSRAPAGIVAELERAAAGREAARAHVVAERGDVDALRDLRLGDERAGAAAAHEVALADELVERGAHGQPRDAEVDAELALGRDRVADARAARSARARCSRVSRCFVNVRRRAPAAPARLERARRSSGSKKWKRARVDRELERLRRRARPCAASTRAVKSAPVGGQQALVCSRFEHLGGDRRRVDVEEDMGVGAELLEHLDPHLDRRQPGRERGVLEALGPDAERRPAVRQPRAARASGTRNWPKRTPPPSTVASTRFIAGEPMNAGDEEVARPLRRAAAGVSTWRMLAVAHHRDALPERHRLDLVVRHVDGRDAEPLVQLRERRAHADAQLRVEVRERLVEQERLRLARRSRGPSRRAAAGRRRAAPAAARAGRRGRAAPRPRRRGARSRPSACAAP